MKGAGIEDVCSKQLRYARGGGGRSEMDKLGGHELGGKSLIVHSD